MNIFKSLTTGHGNISETNITSFLSFLLNSTNELDNSFLVLFLELIDQNLKDNRLADLLQLRQPGLRERISHFSKHFTVTATPEHAVISNEKQIIDVFLKIEDKKNELDIAYILIENKIKTTAKKNLQVSKQYELFIENDDYQKGLPIYSILLTSDFEIFSSMYINAVAINPRCAWIRWTNRQDANNSVEATLRKLLVAEQHAEIQPINPNSQFIIKSFVDYIVTEYSNSGLGRKNFSLNGAEEIDAAKAVLGSANYTLKRYDNHMIRIFDSEDNLLEIEVRPILRKINEVYKLGIDYNHVTGTEKNTQVYGREIIKALNGLLA
ncbi:MAG: PD-(D/E)XK nuclease family protein [Bacteroidota bacterium]